MKLQKIMHPDFQNAMRELNSHKLPIKVGFMLSRITDKLEAEIKRFEDAKIKSIREAGIKDDKGELVPDEGGNIQLSPEDKVRVEAELAEALETEIDVPTMKMSDLSMVSLSGGSVAQLKKDIITED
jgi:hypothetical protein